MIYKVFSELHILCKYIKCNQKFNISCQIKDIWIDVKQDLQIFLELATFFFNKKYFGNSEIFFFMSENFFETSDHSVRLRIWIDVRVGFR